MYDKNLVDIDDLGDFCEFLHNLCDKNLQPVKVSKVCGCFHCQTLFKCDNVIEFETIDDGLTVLCPFCGIDSVLPYMQETEDEIGWSKQIILEVMFDKYFCNKTKTSCQ
jgi:hypothetical protein